MTQTFALLDIDRRPREVVSCLASNDSGVRLAAAQLVLVLVKDVLYSKTVVFPEATRTTEGKR